MQSFALLYIPLVCIFGLLPSTMASIPYNPTRILQNASNLFVFQPLSGSSSQFQLGSIDISSTISASNLPYTLLHSELPFLAANAQYPFTPILDHGGNITVYTGDCTMGASGAEIWTFTPETSDKGVNGTWSQEDVSFEQNAKSISAIGSNYLNGGMAFSALVNGDAKDTGAYFFGGMCPFQDSNDTNWQSAANYSNVMVTLEPTQDGSRLLNYQLGVSTSHGPPITEAGFTLTGLQPTFSNRSDGTQTQQQNFVLIGGHTSAAFINMSQVALFSLPQQGWTFIPVRQPSTQQTDLEIRAEVQEVEPRSGHSAVLTPDGQRIIVFGGWIGDSDTPADPQLAVLNVGDSYGGEGDWTWTVPSTYGPGLPSGSGVYGHGAAMLPGGVMMIMGGYSMAAPSSRRRRADSGVNAKTLFFNVTSNSWISEYTPPAEITSTRPNKDGFLTTTSQKVGLGVGLGIGMAAILGLLVSCLWYTTRMKSRRKVGEEQLRELAIGAHRDNMECLSLKADGRGGNLDAADYFDDPNESYFYPSAGTDRNQGWRRTNGHDAERTGLLVEIPSPTRGLRKGLGGRNQQMARYEERRVRGPGNIHPIDELEEEPEHNVASRGNTLHDKPIPTSQPEMSERPANRGVSVFDNAPIAVTDNDQTSTVGSGQRNMVHPAPTCPIRVRGEEPDHVPSDWQLALGAPVPRRSSPNSAGRVSPTKSDRTGSTLSDRTWSNLSSNSAGLGRSASMRSAAIINGAHANHSKSPGGSPTTDRADPQTRSSTSTRNSAQPNTANADGDSFTTARTSFMQLQAEGEVLLGGNPDRERTRPRTSSTSNGSNANTYQTTEPSMSRAGTLTAATSSAEARFRPTTERRRSWLGSVRRVLSRSITTNETRRRSLTTSVPTLESYTDDPIFPRPSKDKRRSLPASSSPRRAASDASFWRSKRGKQDWLDEEIDPDDPQARWRRNSGDDWGAPEDLALAEQERLKREWRERSTLINLDDDLPIPRTPILAADLGVPDDERLKGRPQTPLDEDDWDVEAAVERRVVQVMFTVPRSKLRVVNADADRNSMLSLVRENSDELMGGVKKGGNNDSPAGNSSPGRVRDLAGRFEQLASSPRTSPRPSPSGSIRSVKVRGKASSRSLAQQAQERSRNQREEQREE
ncbi:hypothetical protein K504DRAFT_476619 [Pleomassaria siparia CBS 279.74]|uniref:Galactose oxidase n=1 Tax=Pleomassaria siparia CBS 279.74 TaxID=1314801 RepID=A0A6G1K9P1_9PLEO|nr:hypothetical protein K504DRAFT_476619 [Pleomassaria siparia CBS 279.74]